MNTRIIEQWRPLIVVLSFVIAYFGSYTSIVIYEQLRLCSKENRPKLLHPIALYAFMSISLGGVAIWCMHFVGMSALTIIDPSGHVLPVYYRTDFSVSSLVIVCIFCFASLLICSRDKVYTQDNTDVVAVYVREARKLSITEIRKLPHKYSLLFKALFRNPLPLILGGILSGTGVCVMHYMGMMAMVFPGKIVWNKGIVTASVFIALVAATAAYWILFRLLALFPHIEMLRVLCAVIMAVAVNGMHYTGMSAAKFIYNTNEQLVLPPHVHITSQTTAVIAALAGAAIFLQLVSNICIADMKVWLINATHIVKEADTLIKLHQDDPESNPAAFMTEYMYLRSHDGDTSSILRFKSNLSNSYRIASNNSSESGASNPVEDAVEDNGDAFVDKADMDTSVHRDSRRRTASISTSFQSTMGSGSAAVGCDLELTSCKAVATDDESMTLV